MTKKDEDERETYKKKRKKKKRQTENSEGIKVSIMKNHKFLTFQKRKKWQVIYQNCAA